MKRRFIAPIFALLIAAGYGAFAPAVGTGALRPLRASIQQPGSPRAQKPWRRPADLLDSA